jgi:hypothetical protein
MNPAAAQLILQSQALMMQLLDLQKWQQQVALRFVEAHQQLIQSYGSGAAAPPALTPIEPAASAPVAAPKSVPLRAVPVAVAAVPKPVPAATAVAAGPASRLAATPAPVVKSLSPAQAEPHITAAPGRNGENGHGHPIPAPHVLPVAPAAQTTSPDEGLPTVEEFQADLLQAVSDRTGYPIEMLDLSLPMESGLGIDSIKTVEIFSNLKKYHPYFQQEDQDEEEALKEFTKLKTLGDIISAYDLRYQALTSGSATAKKTEDQGAVVERYTLEAVAAPASAEKKTTLAGN